MPPLTARVGTMKPLTSMFRDVSKAAFKHGIRTYANMYRGYFVKASELKEIFRNQGFNVDERNAWLRYIQTWIDARIMIRSGYAYFVLIDYETDDMRNTAGECLYLDRLENKNPKIVYVDNLSLVDWSIVNENYEIDSTIIDLEIDSEKDKPYLVGGE